MQNFMCGITRNFFKRIQWSNVPVAHVSFNILSDCLSNWPQNLIWLFIYHCGTKYKFVQ